MGEIVGLDVLVAKREEFRVQNKKVVFTNGTFDVLHRGHVEYLVRAKGLGDVLIVGVNSDRSVRAVKGNGRPVMEEADRAFLLANLRCVDYVIIFDDKTPLPLIQSLHPDVLVKGADWAVNDIVGKDVVEEYGGSVQTIELTPGKSSSSLIKKIRELPVEQTTK